MTVVQVSRGALEFDVVESGPADGEPVLLLHGFPQHASSWEAVAARLNAAGYRTLAMQQRGYTPRARPRGRYAYRATQMVGDCVAVIDQLAGGRAHVVGHDWGSAVAWSLAALEPARVRTLTAVSVPHVFGFLRAMVTSRQGLSSWYMYCFQLPWLPERLLRAQWDRFLVGYGGQTPAAAQRDRAEFDADPGSLTGALNWYRAMPFLNLRKAMKKVTVPTLFVFSDGDRFIGQRSVDLCPEYVTGPYRLETLHGVTHWIADQEPDKLADLVLSHIAPG